MTLKQKKFWGNNEYNSFVFHPFTRHIRSLKTNIYSSLPQCVNWKAAYKHHFHHKFNFPDSKWSAALLAKGKQWIPNLFIPRAVAFRSDRLLTPYSFHFPPQRGRREGFLRGQGCSFSTFRGLPAVFRNHSQRGGTRCIFARKKNLLSGEIFTFCARNRLTVDWKLCFQTGLHPVPFIAPLAKNMLNNRYYGCNFHHVTAQERISFTGVL